MPPPPKTTPQTGRKRRSEDRRGGSVASEEEDKVGVIFQLPKSKRDQFKSAVYARGESLRDVLEGFVDLYLEQSQASTRKPQKKAPR